MHVFIINLDSATERWKFVSESFSRTEMEFTRIPGVLGRTVALPHPQYKGASFARRHGHQTNYGQIGCYFSHLKSLQTFLDSPHQHAIIAEDDALPVNNLGEIVDRALDFQPTWDILRLAGFHNPHPKPYATLIGNYKLCVCFTRLCGTGAYLVTRKAAKVLLDRLDPMLVPIDHAIDREWVYGLRSAAVVPLPITQTAHRFVSQCNGPKDDKLPWYVRYWTVFPYRAWTETSRYVYRHRQLSSARRLAG